jgi:Phage integrase family
MAAVDKIAKTGKRGAAKDLRKHTHTLVEWCVGEGYVDHNVLAGYRAPKETRAQRVGRRTKGRALTDEEIIKVWHACGKLGAFGLLTRMWLLGGPRRSEPTMIEWRKHVMDDRITFDAAWTKMGLHHDVPRTHLVDEVLTAAKHFQRATSDYVFPSPKTGGQMSGFTKMVNRLVKEAGVAKFTMHDLRRSLRTVMSRCGYDNEIQRLRVGQKPSGIDQVYNHDEQWIIRKTAFEAAHDYIAELVGAMRVGKLVRLQRTNPLDPIKAELLGRLHEHYAAETAYISSLIASGQIFAHRIDTIERVAVDVAPFQRVVGIAPPLLQRSWRAPDDRGRLQCRQVRAAWQRIDIEGRGRRHPTVLAMGLRVARDFAATWRPRCLGPSLFVLAAHAFRPQPNQDRFEAIRA